MTEPEGASPAGNGVLKIAALGDLHVKEEHAAPYRELFAEISREADVFVLTGDLTDLGKPREAEILAEDLRACSSQWWRCSATTITNAAASRR